MNKLFLISLLLVAFLATAEEVSLKDVAQDQPTEATPNYDQIARERLYQGGSDEEDLQVQENLITPQQGYSEKYFQAKYIKEILNRRQASQEESENN